MSWNYRVIKKEYKFGAYKEIEYSIHEVYYKDKDNGEDYNNINFYSIAPTFPTGETPEGFKEMLELYNGALAKPTLDGNLLEQMFPNN